MLLRPAARRRRRAPTRAKASAGLDVAHDGEDRLVGHVVPRWKATRSSRVRPWTDSGVPVGRLAVGMAAEDGPLEGGVGQIAGVLPAAPAGRSASGGASARSPRPGSWGGAPRRRAGRGRGRAGPRSPAAEAKPESQLAVGVQAAADESMASAICCDERVAVPSVQQARRWPPPGRPCRPARRPCPPGRSIRSGHRRLSWCSMTTTRRPLAERLLLEGGEVDLLAGWTGG